MCSINQIELIVKMILKQSVKDKVERMQEDNYPKEEVIFDTTNLVLLIILLLFEFVQLYYYRIKIRKIMAQQERDSIQIEQIHDEKHQGFVHVEDAIEIFVTTAHELNMMTQDNEQELAEQIRALSIR